MLFQILALRWMRSQNLNLHDLLGSKEADVKNVTASQVLCIHMILYVCIFTGMRWLASASTLWTLRSRCCYRFAEVSTVLWYRYGIKIFILRLSRSTR